MVAHNSASPLGTESVLDPDLLAEIADLRARALSWEDVAAKVQWDVTDLRRVIRRDPAYPAALEAAEEEVWREGQAEGFARLRALTKDPDPDRAKEASEIIMRYSAEKMKYAAQKHRDETRLEVERLRAEGRRLKAAKVCEPDEDDSGLTPEDEAQMDARFRERQDRRAEELAREKATVYLWGACHPLGVPPDPTDTPLAIVSDGTAVRGRTIYWVVTDPMPTDPCEGPFLPPPGCRPRTCPDPEPAA